MKSILISIRPQWCEKICHVIGKDEMGKPIYEKRIEVRKSAPKEVPFKAYIYVTKYGINGRSSEVLLFNKRIKEVYCGVYRNACYYSKDNFEICNGHIIGEFICDKVYSIKNQRNRFVVANDEQGVTNEIARQSCLDYYDMVNYLGNKDGYGWHIADLKIYGKPKELSEFCGRKKLTRPPQSWQFVEEKR